MIDDAGQLQQESKALVAAFVRGEHQIMVSAEEAVFSLELLVEIRDKFLLCPRPWRESGKASLWNGLGSEGGLRAA